MPMSRRPRSPAASAARRRTSSSARNEDPDKKTKEFMENMMRLVKEEALLDRIRKSWLAFTVNSWGSIKMLTFYWGLLIHMALIFGSYAPHHGLHDLMDGSQSSHDSFEAASDEAARDSFTKFFYHNVLPFVDSAARWMCVGNGAICALRYFAFLWAQIPVIIINGLAAMEDEEDDDSGLADLGGGEDEVEEDAEVLFIDDVKGDQSSSSRDVEKDEEDVGALASGPGILTHAGIVLGSAFFWYETVFLAMAALAIFWDEPLCTAVFCLEVVTFSGSQTVVAAIRFKVLEMINTLFLGIAIMYIWMMAGMLLFRQMHEPDDENVCVNMFQCFLAYVFISLRGDGVKDLLGDLSIPLNIVDSVLPDQGFFLPLLLWDFVYNWIFIYILLAIITGIVIDAFGGLRDEKDSAEDNLRAFCFVCNLERFKVDQSGIGFEKHVRTEHNPRWYLFFLIYIRGKSESLLTGQEKYVRARVWPAAGKPSCDWIPRECTDSIQESAEEDDGMAKVEERINTLDGKMESMTSALERIENLLSRPDYRLRDIDVDGDIKERAM